MILFPLLIIFGSHGNCAIPFFDPCRLGGTEVRSTSKAWRFVAVAPRTEKSRVDAGFVSLLDIYENVQKKVKDLDRVVTFMGIPVVPDVNKVILCDDTVKNFSSALSGFGISAKFF